MNRLKFKRSKFKNILYIVIIIIFTYFYIITFINTNFSSLLINSINERFNIEFNYNFKDRLLYNSLNKIVSLEELNTISNTSNIETISYEIVENKSDNPIVYIYNTHDTEKYSLPFISDYSITPDVKLASYILKDHLNDLNIESFVQTKSISDYLKQHNLGYTGSYEASRVYMKEEMEKYDFKILIDLHRDSVNYKYTLFELNNKKYAKVMFVLATKNKNYKENEKFANYLNDKINEKYKGLSRGIMIRKDVIFNQDLSPNAILIELGGVDNTIDEINNSLEVIAQILSEYIKEML